MPTIQPHKFTLKDVAQQVGCSQNTVSLALRGSTRISAPVRGKITRIAAKLGYVPNYAASNLASQRSGIIGIYTQALYDAVRTTIVNDLLIRLHTNNYKPVLGLAENIDTPWYQSPWLHTFKAMKVEALLIVTESDITAIPENLESVPLIFVGNQPHKNLKCDYIAIDRREAGQIAVEHLIRQGHQDILIACNSKSYFGSGCVNVIKKNRANAHFVKYPSVRSIISKTDEQAHIERWANYLLQNRQVSAVVFVDAPLAVRFLRHLDLCGIRVPADVSILSYDYFPWAQDIRIPLTTIEQPLAQLIDTTVEVVQNRLRRLSNTHTQLVLKHNLVVRESTQVHKLSR
ncbi:MAG: hypothetical protein A2Y13_04505 [Planctomycetes bacterium GWC2_45_44]|nr:MAG: hypothetical protein A2Y13_04505 [Planctomycetes bacterium GWC2_45_44]HBR19413.1 hypothetical protein [Phycisphaerales bacterium]